MYLRFVGCFFCRSHFTETDYGLSYSARPEKWCEALFKKIDVKFRPNIGKPGNPALSPGPSLEDFGNEIKGSSE